MVFTTNLTEKFLYSIFVLRSGGRRGRESSLNGAEAEILGGLTASKEAARSTLKIEHNLAASIGEVCRDYAKSSRPKENGEA